MPALAQAFGSGLFDPLRDQFMQRAALEIVLISLATGALGCWVVFYEVSYAAESLAHSIFPGLVIAALVGVPLLVGGAPAIALAAVAIALAGKIPGIGQDTAVAVIVTGFFGAGALLALSPTSPPGIETLLFGDILGTSDGDLLLAAILGAAILVALRLLHTRLLAVGFDRSSARSLGASAGLAEVALLVMLAAAVLIAVQGLGNLLVVAIIVGPAACARMLSGRLVPMMALSVAISIAAGLLGLYASYYFGTAAGASIAACVVGIYFLCLAIPDSLAKRIRGGN
jgi:ABC-type Mn2+/Zn2+ transport system permease subunit